MPLSTHYYVISLGARTNVLYEAFRDSLIEVENLGFPVVSPGRTSGKVGDDQMLELARTVDTSFTQHYSVDPMRLVIAGDEDMQSAFRAVTTHEDAVVGWVDGDHTNTSARDLGQIVWPVVKDAMSGMIENALRDLEASSGRGKTTSGLEAVIRVARGSEQATLLVEDDYHKKGSIVGTTEAPSISPEVDVREAIDDAVDAVIEEVLRAGGNVVFTPNGSLKDQNRIVLLPFVPDSA